MLIIEYMGGEHSCLTAIAQREEGIAHAWPMNYCLKNIKVENMIRGPKRGALQFVILKPMMAITSVVVHACGKYESEIYQWTLFFIYNISYTVALYALFLIYKGTKAHPALVPRKPLLKFIAVKGVIFFTFWQSIVFPWFVHSHREKWENFLFIVEFFLFAFVMNHVAFVWSEFRETLKDNQGSQPQATESAGSEGVDTNGTVSSNNPRDMPGWKQNARNAFSPKDVVNDASRSFSSRYTRHVLLETSQEYVIEDQEEDQEQKNNDGKPASAQNNSGKRRFFGRTFLVGSTMGPQEGGSQIPEAPTTGSPHGTVLGNSQLAATTDCGPDSKAGTVSLEPVINGTSSTESRPAQDQV
eukprot:gnl/MRDRNA2_/MRDRNA2_128066_c0_seq1.p1 gnl/MRDRNA2_/MRDRNA2_128066_c0~~gnl/MRDRNA2_/MRDRNA2_128066_c0_seq1.p1  ORF type:complete len:356 (-),score=52.97 gnl/MRDRNA2_/MRDRNA2_128066_c0_seq1:56-1123(-)